MKSALRLTWILVNTAPFATSVSERRFMYPASWSSATSTPSMARRAPSWSGGAQLRSWPSMRRAMASVTSSECRMS